MAPHSSTLAWKIPWTEEPGGLQYMGSHRVRHDWETSLSLFTFHFHALEKEMATHSSVPVWKIPGTGKPDVLSSMGPHRVGHDWSDLAAAAAAAVSKSCLPLFSIPWTVSRQAPLSMGFSRQEHWKQLLSPPPGDLPNRGTEHVSCIGRWILYHGATREDQS